MNYDIIIVGGGASGMCTAIKAKTEDNTILIIEHNDRIGKKILSTGNGKCNLTNMFCVPEYMEEDRYVDTPEGIYPFFSYTDSSFPQKVIASFDADDTVGFFASLGLLTFSRNGYVYPRAEQAAVVLDTLRYECERKGVDIITGYQSLKIQKITDSNGNRFEIDGEYRCRALVIATGGMSAPKTGSDGSGYEIAGRFGHKIIKPLPALCGIRCSDKYFRKVSGVRTDGQVTLYDGNDRELISAYGNLQFNAWGISGIPVFQISSQAVRLLDSGEKIKLRADLMPDLENEVLAGFLNRCFMRITGRAGKAQDCADIELTAEILNGFMNKKLAAVIAADSAQIGSMHKSQDFGTRLVAIIKHFRITPDGFPSFDEAQTTSGGVSTAEIDPETMQSKICEGLFFTGEIMDVNGICGGYNLQWAWSTAHIAAETLKNIRR